MLSLLAAVPAAMCFHLSYTFHSELVAKRAQSQLRSDLNTRARRISQQTQKVAVCTASDPGLQACHEIEDLVRSATREDVLGRRRSARPQGRGRVGRTGRIAAGTAAVVLEPGVSSLQRHRRRSADDGPGPPQAGTRVVAANSKRGTQRRGQRRGPHGTVRRKRLRHGMAVRTGDHAHAAGQCRGLAIGGRIDGRGLPAGAVSAPADLRAGTRAGGDAARSFGRLGGHEPARARAAWLTPNGTAPPAPARSHLRRPKPVVRGGSHETDRRR